MKHLLLSSILLFASSLHAKQPLSLDSGLQLKAPAQLTLEKPAALQRKVSNKPQLPFKPQPLQVARTVMIQESLLKLAPWETINNQSYSRLQLSGAKAEHLSLGFENVKLPTSAQLFILDAATSKVLQQFSASDVTNGSLWTPMLDSKQVIIEINVLAWEREQVSLDIKQAGYGTSSMFSALQKSGSCNIDVVCTEGDAWRDVIRSVARYTIQNSLGTFVCTGTLMNNDNQDQRPLFLTAAHCLVSESTADTMSIYWNYETSVCGGTPDGSLAQVQTGVNYLSRSEGIGTESDFALVELRNRLPANYMVHYSGWNAIAQNAANVATIHHPAGDEKRISLDADPLTITEYNSEIVDETEDYYRIASWDVGTTEGGSSGSGIWNANKELIGTLSGGLASCAAPGSPDWYGRLSSHWAPSNEPLQQLAMYLAPETGALTLAGFEPCDAAAISLGLSTATPAVNTQFNFSSQVTGGSTPYTYAWDFNADNTSDSAEVNPAHIYATAGKYTAQLDITDANQCKSSARINIIVPDASELFVDAGQIPTGYIEPGTADAGWISSAATASEGAFSLRAEIINEDEVAAVQLTDSFLQGTLTFNYRVSSEAGFDFFKFYVDDVEQLSGSGEVAWTQASINIAAGTRSLKWTFEKDDSVSVGLDTAWLDDVAFVADAVQPTPTPTPTPTPSPSGGGGGTMPIWLLLGLLTYTWARIRLVRQNTGQ